MEHYCFLYCNNMTNSNLHASQFLFRYLREKLLVETIKVHLEILSFYMCDDLTRAIQY